MVRVDHPFGALGVESGERGGLAERQPVPLDRVGGQGKFGAQRVQRGERFCFRGPESPGGVGDPVALTAEALRSPPVTGVSGLCPG